MTTLEQVNSVLTLSAIRLADRDISLDTLITILPIRRC
jgi:hypothetical protein